MHLFFSVGEPSGDQHAAHLMEAIRQHQADARFSGFGGPLMEQAGLESLFRLTDTAVMGLSEVIPQLRTFYRQVKRARQFLEQERPDAVILVDFPGFNWNIAKAAKRLGIPVMYYMPPQLWAWAAWRIRKVRKWVDVILAALPFEAEWYRSQGVDVEYVGHPFFDDVANHPLDQAFLDRCRYDDQGHMLRNIGILPGSRTLEVQRNVPTMLSVMRQLADRHEGIRFQVACYKESHRQFFHSRLVGRHADLPVELHVGKTPEIIEIADCCLMVSGSVSLEILARTTPAVVQYRCGLVMGSIAWFVVRCPFISLPNLIAGREVLPEHKFVFREEQHAAEIFTQLDALLGDPKHLEEKRQELVRFREEIVRTGGIAKAAETILQRLSGQKKSAVRPSRAA